MKPSWIACRIALTALWVFLIALFPAGSWPWQALSLPSLVLATAVLRLPVRQVFRRALVLWMLAALMGLGLLAQPDWLLRVGNLLLKSTLSLWALSLLVHSASVPELIAGLRWLRVPKVWIEALAFWGRYYAVLAQEWHRLQLARQARTLERDRRREFRVLANMLALLFIHAYERAEKVHRAMLARGYRDAS